jgi:hypothetical protein
MNDSTEDELDGFIIGEVGWGFYENDLYSYIRNKDTTYMGNLYKTREEAIKYEIEDTKKYLNELEEMLKNE